MSQVFRQLIARSFLAARTPLVSNSNLSKCFRNLNLDNSNLFSSHSYKFLAVNGASNLRFFVTNSNPTNSTLSKEKKETLDDDEFEEVQVNKNNKRFQQRDDYDDRDHNRRFPSYRNERNSFEFRQGNRQNFNGRGGGYKKSFVKTNDEYNNYEQVESSGTASNYESEEGENEFSKFNLPPKLLARLDKLNYKKPYEIQSKTLVHTLGGRDLIGRAFTGSGKTLAFAIPIITNIMNSPNKESRHAKCLVLSPTRELCIQLQKSIQDLAPELKCLAIYGGTNYQSQLEPLRGKVDIVCATPGRLRDLIQRKNFSTDEIEIICLDEADELLTPNFLEQIQDVIEISNKKQMLMFSATINRNVRDLVKTYMNNPIFVDLTENKKNRLPTNIKHCIVDAHQESYPDLILHYLKEFSAEKCIVFTNRKTDAIKFNYHLRKCGIKSSDLHSDISQSARQNILRSFRGKGLDVIIATDVAARGIDIPEINLVINAGFPSNGIDYYIHRSGRTGRAGRLGTAITFNDGSIDRNIFKMIKFEKLIAPESIKSSSIIDNSDLDDYQDRKYIKKQFNPQMSRSFEPRERFQKRDYYKSYDEDKSPRFKSKYPALERNSDILE